MKIGNLELDILYRKWVLSLGIDIGSNRTFMKKRGNIFIEISILFWTFGAEYTFPKKKQTGI